MGTRLRELVERLGGQLVGDGDIDVVAVATLGEAGPAHVTFLSNPKLRTQAASTGAAAIILSSADDAVIGSSMRGARIIVDNPYLYFARTAQFFYEKNAAPVESGIHASAVVDASARIGSGVHIGPCAVIEAEAAIGDGCVIGAGSFVGRAAKIGAGTRLFARATIHAECEIGMRGIVHSGAVIGTDGFGFANDKGKWVKIPQTGRVVIGDDVDIGANTTIDRGALTDTVIEDGVKLDNQIQIGHNCRIGAHTAMAGCVGVAGSAKIGKYCTFGGAAMILGHLEIADNVHISSGSLVSRSIAEPGHYTGFYPLAKNAEWEKSAAVVRNLAAMREKVRGLEKKIKSLTEENDNE